MFKDSSSLPVFFGTDMKYWEEVSDGFMWRDTPNSCLDYVLKDIAVGGNFDTAKKSQCVFKPAGTLTDHYSKKPKCDGLHS
jgi:hypothetical protein